MICEEGAAGAAGAGTGRGAALDGEKLRRERRREPEEERRDPSEKQEPHTVMWEIYIYI